MMLASIDLKVEVQTKSKIVLDVINEYIEEHGSLESVDVSDAYVVQDFADARL